MGSTLKTRARIILTSLLGRDFNSSKISALVEGCSLISFDVFDTLILRSSLSVPSDLFDMLSTGPSFKAMRITAEKQAHEEGKSRGLEDIKIEEIYKKLYPNDSKKQREGMDLEISTELSVCKANPEALKFFNTVKKLGKRVVIVSDMYLDRSTIETILTENGYDLNRVSVYVSSEYGKTKRSGSLFTEVLKTEQGEAGKTLHIGDNLISDYVMPRRVGMKSFLYKRPH